MILWQVSFIVGVTTEKIFRYECVISKAEKEKISGKLFYNHAIQTQFEVYAKERVTFIFAQPKRQKQ